MRTRILSWCWAVIPGVKSTAWDSGIIVTTFAMFYWRLKKNSSSFDDTELATIGECGVWTVSSMVTLITFRGIARYREHQLSSREPPSLRPLPEDKPQR